MTERPVHLTLNILMEPELNSLNTGPPQQEQKQRLEGLRQQHPDLLKKLGTIKLVDSIEVFQQPQVLRPH